MKKMKLNRCSDCSHCVREEGKKYIAHCDAMGVDIVFPDMKKLCKEYEEKPQ